MLFHYRETGEEGGANKKKKINFLFWLEWGNGHFVYIHPDVVAVPSPRNH